jgi:hypothetical protein
MSITLETYPLTIRKGGKFYQEFQLLEDDGQPISFTGKTLKGRILESVNSTTVIAELTEANGGMVQVDTTNGIFGMLLTSLQTSVITAANGVYDILQIDDAYPTIESEYIVKGPITFIEGITEQ